MRSFGYRLVGSVEPPRLDGSVEPPGLDAGFVEPPHALVGYGQSPFRAVALLDTGMHPFGQALFWIRADTLSGRRVFGYGQAPFRACALLDMGSYPFRHALFSCLLDTETHPFGQALFWLRADTLSGMRSFGYGLAPFWSWFQWLC
jgi:hypothetical protein